MSEAERTLRVRVKFGFDRETSTESKKAGDEVTKQTRKVKNELDQARQRAVQLREAFERIQRSGMYLASIGAAITAPFLLASKSYIKFAGQADSASRQWIANQKRMEQATMRIGRVATTQLLPVMNRVAGIAEKAAAFAERNPGAVKVALGIGATLTIVGAAIMTIAKAVAVISGLKAGFLALAKLAGGGAAAAAGGAAAPAAGAGGAAVGAGITTAGGILSGVAGVGIGAAIYQALAKSDWVNAIIRKSPIGKGSAGLASLEQYASVAAYGLGKLVGGTDTATRWFTKVAGSLGALDTAATGAAGALQGSGVGGRVISQAAVDTYISYRKSLDKAQVQYDKQRAQIVSQGARQRAKMQADEAKSEARELAQYNRNRAKMFAQFQRDEKREEESYYRQRKEAAAAHSKEAKRDEEDHQKELRRMRQDYDAAQLDAIADRNFDAYMENLNNYERDRKAEEEDYRTSVGRRDQDFAQELAEMEEQYNLERQQRQADFQLQQTEAAEEYAIQKADRAVAYADQLAELDASQAEQLAEIDSAYEDQKKELQDAFVEQLAALDENLLGERELRGQYYDLMKADLETWLQDMSESARANLYGGTVTPKPKRKKYDVIGGRQMGGYVGAGTYQMHPGEFVLNAGTARMAERIVGGPLTQQNIISGGSHSSLDINVSGPYNADLVPTIRKVAGQFMGEVIVHLKGAGAAA